jgi:hypothetical protein
MEKKVVVRDKLSISDVHKFPDVDAISLNSNKLMKVQEMLKLET